MTGSAKGRMIIIKLMMLTGWPNETIRAYKNSKRRYLSNNIFVDMLAGYQAIQWPIRRVIQYGYFR